MIRKRYFEFVCNQEMQHDSLYHFLGCLKDWWKMHPRIVRCWCGQRMWTCGKHGPEYCSQECAYYDGVPDDSEELPF